MHSVEIRGFFCRRHIFYVKSKLFSVISQDIKTTVEEHALVVHRVLPLEESPAPAFSEPVLLWRGINRVLSGVHPRSIPTGCFPNYFYNYTTITVHTTCWFKEIMIWRKKNSIVMSDGLLWKISISWFLGLVILIIWMNSRMMRTMRTSFENCLEFFNCLILLWLSDCFGFVYQKILYN